MALKTKEIREKSEADLNAELLDLRKQMFTLRTQAVTQKLEDSSRIGKIRKDVARIHTVLTEKKKAAAPTKVAKASK